MSDFLTYMLNDKSSINKDVQKALNNISISEYVKYILGYLISEEIKQENITLNKSKVFSLINKPHKIFLMTTFIRYFDTRDDKSINFYEWSSINAVYINNTVLNICLAFYMQKYLSKIIDANINIQLSFFKLHDMFIDYPELINIIQSLRYKTTQILIQFNNEHQERYTYMFFFDSQKLRFKASQPTDGSRYVPQNYSKICDEIILSQNFKYLPSLVELLTTWHKVKNKLTQFVQNETRLPKFLANIDDIDLNHIDIVLYITKHFKQIQEYGLSKTIFPMPMTAKQKNMIIEISKQNSINFKILNEATRLLDIKMNIIETEGITDRLTFIEQFALDLHHTKLLLSDRFGSEHYPVLLHKQKDLSPKFKFISTSSSYQNLTQSLTEIYSMCEYFKLNTIEQLQEKLKNKTFIFVGEIQNKREDKAMISVLLKFFDVNIKIITPKGFMNISYIPDLSPYNINKMEYPNYEEVEIEMQSDTVFWETILNDIEGDILLYVSNAKQTPDAVTSLEQSEYKIPLEILQKFELVISNSKNVTPIKFKTFNDQSINSLITAPNKLFVMMSLISMIIYPKSDDMI